MERYSRVLEERFWRGNEKGLFDLGLLLLSDLPLSLFIPRSKEAAEGSKVRPNKFLKSVNNLKITKLGYALYSPIFQLKVLKSFSF